MKKLIVLDSSYSLEAILDRKLEESVTCRDLDGFFNHVWTVHPFATLVTSDSWTSRYGEHNITKLSPSHTFIEFKVGRFHSLKWIPQLNFLLGQIQAFFFLTRLIKTEKINLIRVSSPLYIGLLGLAIARWCNIPLVVRVGGNHDKIYETTGRQMEKRVFFHRKIEKMVERFVFRRADLVAGANQDNLNFALSNGARKEFSTLFRYGNLIDKRHRTEPSMRIGGDVLLKEINIKPYKFILFIGRLESVKHPDHVVKVLADVRRRGYDIKALIVGDGQLRHALVDLAYECGVIDQVVFAGNKDQEWLALVIPLASCVISPHTGRALTEAALGGVPIVAYDIDWQNELIENRITGELVPYLDIIMMGDSVIRILSDPVYSRNLGDEIRNKAIKMMDASILNQHERDQYSRVIHRYEKQWPQKSEV